MTFTLAIIADPHLCTEPRRRNAVQLALRKPWKHIDTIKVLADQSQAKTWKQSSYDDKVLCAAARTIESISDIDLLVLLGDVATTGLAEDLTVAQEVFLDQGTELPITLSGEPRFGGLGVPIHVVPGNHDRYQNQRGKPGGKTFDGVFSQVYRPKNGVCRHILEKNGSSICILSADFTYPADVDVDILRQLGGGRVEGTVLNQLEFQTRQLKKERPETVVVWAIHFSPLDSAGYALGLDDRQHLLHQARLLGVNNIFCGHVHERRSEKGTFPHIYCAGSVSAIDARGEHYIHLCSIDYDSDGAHLEVFDLKYHESGPYKDQFRDDPIPDDA